MKYCNSLTEFSRFKTRVVKVGNLEIGGDNPIAIQSMTITDTMDTIATVEESIRMIEAGCELLRITAPSKKEAENLQKIKDELRERGYNTPIVADIHFTPNAAEIAARIVEKVRINPGNYADKKKFEIREYSDQQYLEELQRIREQFTPLVKICKERGVAMRIGTNHGSLSDRIMNRYGDTPRGMVESAMEFARIARELDYHEFVFSMKASNPKVMIIAYRLLVSVLEAEGTDWNYPLHLGVTEAGDGEDGRIKSAIGIGSLLMDGIGDTIRVSLTEDAVREVPVARALAAICEREVKKDPINFHLESDPFDPFTYQRRLSKRIKVQGIYMGGKETVRVFTSEKKFDTVSHELLEMGEFQPEIISETSGLLAIDPRDDVAVSAINDRPDAVPVTLSDGLDVPVVSGFRLLASRVQPRHPLVIKDSLIPSTNPEKKSEETLLVAAANIGSLICDGIGDGILVQGEEGPAKSLRLAYNILQSSGARIFKTDYVACPSCGRTLFDLQETTAKIRAATGHLKGVRIAVMGCIVNGPGEMADADFGYVGGAPDKINLYVGKQAVKFNIPQQEAVDRLIDLIKEHDRWMEGPDTIIDPV